MDESSWTLVAQYGREADLVSVCRQLDYLRIRYRVRRDTGQQELWVSSPEHVETTLKVLAFFEQEWEKSRQPGNSDGAPGRPLMGQSFTLGGTVQQFPVVVSAILLGVIGTLIVSYQFDWVHWFTFQDFAINGSRIGFYPLSVAFEEGQYWRLISPAFLHFGIFHFAFNALWMWELGRRIERLAGSLHFLTVFLITALLANIAQYWWDGPALFGGLSGVVYGLLGYLWIRHRVFPNPLTAIPPGILGFMLFWLIFCMTGVVGAFLGSGVANAAHAGGLLSGMLLGGAFGLLARTKQRNLL